MSHPLENAAVAVDFVCNTTGDGLWSKHVAAVRCTKLEITYVASHDDDGEDLADGAAPVFGELQVSFDLATWNPDEHGLIYTDQTFMIELHDALVDLGFSRLAAQNVGYSEQGMQGDEYVSLDVGMVFLAEASKLFVHAK